jgi:acyl-CoA synthetase (AMP-forming)/AMP-acid ligase II
MADTLLEILRSRGTDQASREALVFDGVPITFGELWLGITRFAGLLLARGVASGDRVVLAVPNSLEFFPVFYGIQSAGAIAVPVFPDSGAERVFDVADLCRAAAVVVPSNADTARREEFDRLSRQRRRPVLSMADVKSEDTGGDLPPVERDAVAFIQYTSGSTGDPKGVQLSHADLLTNMRQMITGMEITADDVFVSWLPVYHDMD